MDYTKLRKFIVRSVMERTMDWNGKAKAYPVKPPGLSESKEALWLLITGDTRIGELSAVQSRALKETIAEGLGVEMPVLDKRELKDIPPYVALTSMNDTWRVVSKERIMFHKLNGAWVSEAGRTVERDTISTDDARLPTLEEVERMVESVPDDKLPVGFGGLLPFKKKAEHLAELREKMQATADEFFKGKPTYGDLSEEEKRAYQYAYSKTLRDTLIISLMLQGKEFKDDIWNMMSRMETKPEVKRIMCVRVDGTPRMMLNSTNSLTKKGIEVVELTWDNVTPCEPADMDKLVKDAPMPYLFVYLDKEVQAKMLDELEVPDADA